MSRLNDFVRNWLMAFVDPRRAMGAFRLPRYLADWRRYNQLAGRNALNWKETYPCLADWVGATPFDPHYFFQTHWAAEKLARQKPHTHVDIGSSVMFVSAVSAFVPLIFIDYRPLQVQSQGLQSVSADVTSLPFADQSVPSLSCLHVIEHIGLGRYGDKLDPTGSFKAATELIRVLRPSGRLLLSTPVGRERIQFNAHRIFAPTTVLSMLTGLTLMDLALVDDQGIFYPQATMDQAARCEYGCGMFEFEKPAV